ncbi:PAS domain S-box protein [Deferribacteres bacterium DY0037]
MATAKFRIAVISDLPDGLCSPEILDLSDIYQYKCVQNIQADKYDLILWDARGGTDLLCEALPELCRTVTVIIANDIDPSIRQELSLFHDVFFSIPPISKSEVENYFTMSAEMESALMDMQIYEEFVEDTDNIITRVDKDARFTYVNTACEGLYGVSRDVLIGQSAFDFTHVDDREFTINAFNSWIKNKLKRTSFINRQVLSDGSVIHVLWTINLHYGSSGEILYINSIAKDITDGYLAEAALKKSESSLRAILDSSQDIVLLLDSDGTILDCNQQFCKEVEIDIASVLGCNLWNIRGMNTNGERRVIFDNVVRTGKPCRFEDYGADNWYSVYIAPIALEDMEQKRFVAFAKNITYRKEAEQFARMNEHRHKSLAILGQMYEADFDEILEYSLESSIEQTQSIGGYIVEYDASIGVSKLKAFKGHSNTEVTLCADQPLEVSRFHDLYTVLRNKEPVLNNRQRSVIPMPDTKTAEYNENSMLVPLMAQGEIRLILAVYGKSRNYNLSEAIGLTHFMEGVWRLRERKEVEKTISLLNQELERKVNVRTAQLKESEVRFRTAFESTVHGMLLIALSGEILQLNNSFAAMLGYDESELVGETVYSITYQDDIKLTTEAMRSIVSGEQNHYDITKRYVRKDGNLVIATANAALIRDNKSNPIYIVANVVNITEAEHTRKERDKIFELSRDIIGIADLDGNIHYLNSAFGELLSYSTADVINSNFRDILRPSDIEQLEIVFQSLQELDSLVDFESMHTLPDGSIKWISWSFTADRVNNRIYSIGRDATDRKVYENTLKDQKDKAEQAGRAKSEFMANISHEIRTPLNAVIGFSELLSARAQDSKAASYINSIKTSGKALLTLINDILDISKLEAAATEPVLAPASIKMLLEEMVRIFGYRTEHTDIKLGYFIAADTPKTMMLDISRLRQVLLNLIGNAVKFTERGEVSISVRCEAVNDERVDLYISVKDTGIGIPKEEMEDIFQAFRQRAGHNINKYGGTGLGLSISSKLVDMMGGEIRVESKVGIGSTFTVILPAILKSDVLVAEDISGGVRYVFQPARVLVADDEITRRVLREMLENTGLSVVEAHSAAAARHIAAEIEPELIICSDRLPDKGLYEAALWIRDGIADFSTKMIALVGTMPNKSHSEIFDDILIKPVFSGKLMITLGRFLEVKDRIVEDFAPAEKADWHTIDCLPAKEYFCGELKKLINSFEGAVDFDYLEEVIESLRCSAKKTSLNEFDKLAERLAYLADNLEIENIRKMLARLKECISDETGSVL